MFVTENRKTRWVLLFSALTSLLLASCGVSKGSGLFGGGGPGSGNGSNSAVQGGGAAGQFSFSGVIRSISTRASSPRCLFGSLIIDGPDGRSAPSPQTSGHVFSLSVPQAGASPDCIARQVFQVSPSLDSLVEGASVEGTFDFDGSSQIIRTIQVSRKNSSATGDGHAVR